MATTVDKVGRMDGRIRYNADVIADQRNRGRSMLDYSLTPRQSQDGRIKSLEQYLSSIDFEGSTTTHKKFPTPVPKPFDLDIGQIGRGRIVHVRGC